MPGHVLGGNQEYQNIAVAGAGPEYGWCARFTVIGSVVGYPKASWHIDDTPAIRRPDVMIILRDVKSDSAASLGPAIRRAPMSNGRHSSKARQVSGEVGVVL